MSDVDVMAALIEQHASAFVRAAGDLDRKRYRASSESSMRAAEALHAAGFRMFATTVDTRQDTLLADLQQRVARLEGYTVGPLL